MTETGWGEFEIKIVVTFKACSGLEPVTLSHMLKLFPPQGVAPSTKKPVSKPHPETATGCNGVDSTCLFPALSVRPLKAHCLLFVVPRVSLSLLCVRFASR